MLWVPSINAHVDVGDFLLASYANRVALSVCRFIRILPNNQFCVTWWWKKEDLHASNFLNIEALPPLCSISNSNLLLCHIQEVTERVLSASTIQTMAVSKVAFVFHAKQFDTEFLDCAGMAPCFFYPIPA
jgi:hypothetical protein